MAKIKIPYFKFRNGRPRWEPGPHLRKQGWKGRNLKDESGEWLDQFAAAKAAQQINEEVAAWKSDQSRQQSTGEPAKDKPPITEIKTVQALFDKYFRSPKFMRLAKKTRRDYRNKARPFLAEFGQAPIKAVKKSFLHGFWEKTYADNGHAMANAIMAVVRAGFSYAVDHDWISTNPALKMKLPQVPPRLVLWMPDEIMHFVKTADQINLPSVADAFIIALHSGQRQGDILSLPDRIFEGDKIKLTQSKRGALYDAPMTPQVITRVKQIRERKRRMPIASMDALVVYEGSGQPYSGDLFGKKFRIVRKEAAKTMPSIADKNFQDLRDTAITRLWEATENMAEVISISGHQMESANQIMKHYLVLNPAMAASAQRKITAHLERQGIEL